MPFEKSEEGIIWKDPTLEEVKKEEVEIQETSKSTFKVPAPSKKVEKEDTKELNLSILSCLFMDQYILPGSV
jgi:hypothetical protein